MAESARVSWLLWIYGICFQDSECAPPHKTMYLHGACTFEQIEYILVYLFISLVWGLWGVRAMNRGLQLFRVHTAEKGSTKTWWESQQLFLVGGHSTGFRPTNFSTNSLGG